MATDLGKPVHDLLIEAVNDLFKKYEKLQIAWYIDIKVAVKNIALSHDYSDLLQGLSVIM